MFRCSCLWIKLWEVPTNMKKGILIGVIAVLLIILAANSMYTVQENEYACTFRLSKYVSTT